ncbi:hypothetical protein RhiirA4_473714 [Rhizophagus irregularis]|uniref:RRM domain-containing protein n=1 Tax=Rhizophagus irregularis TaxID=588596 RepID=A0A2I1H787_9GLOM|nr:hypothetical protein RhiirA4_473714 [Rhizophagus irregularis]
MDQFENTWAVLCTGHCLRVCSASHSPDQRAIRRAHVALLARLPRGSVTTDLSEIAKEIFAKSINISFFYNSYNFKPYAYVHFSSAATKESAMAAMDMPPLMDWQQITEHITTILEEITHLTAEFSQLQHWVKWLEDQHSSQPHPISLLSVVIFLVVFYNAF